jgi:hypothetical protein
MQPVRKKPQLITVALKMFSYRVRRSLRSLFVSVLIPFVVVFIPCIKFAAQIAKANKKNRAALGIVSTADVFTAGVLKNGLFTT